MIIITLLCETQDIIVSYSDASDEITLSSYYSGIQNAKKRWLLL